MYIQFQFRLIEFIMKQKWLNFDIYKYIAYIYIIQGCGDDLKNPTPCILKNADYSQRFFLWSGRLPTRFLKK